MTTAPPTPAWHSSGLPIAGGPRHQASRPCRVRHAECRANVPHETLPGRKPSEPNPPPCRVAGVVLYLPLARDFPRCQTPPPCGWWWCWRGCSVNVRLHRGPPSPRDILDQALGSSGGRAARGGGRAGPSARLRYKGALRVERRKSQRVIDRPPRGGAC